MDLSRAARLGIVLGFGVGLFAALAAGARPEIALVRALGCAVGTSLLAILAHALNSAANHADKNSKDTAGPTHR